MGASLALAGLAGCRRPKEKIVPYVKPPEEVIPGISQYYATSMPLGTSAYGVIVESHEGRPTKIEGNKKHPSTMGATNTLIQASILSLYDPDRSRHIIAEGMESSWDGFVSFWRGLYPALKKNKGKGLAVLSESFASPTLDRLRSDFIKNFPESTWVTYEPVSDENIITGIKQATSNELQPVYDYEKADVVLALDADFNLTESENISASRGFIKGRHLESEDDSMNRLYVMESGFSTTGAMADHRLAVSSAEIKSFVIALAKEVGVKGIENIEISLSEKTQKWLKPLADDLKKTQGKSLVVAGRRQPSDIHALVYAINTLLGNNGNTVKYYNNDYISYSDKTALSGLVDKMNAGDVSTLIILGGNPGYDIPADLNFTGALSKVSNKIYLGSYNNETTDKTTWHIPQAHYLESWGDVRSVDGTLGVVQPLIEPLFDSHSTVEMLNLIVSGENASGYDVVRSTWSDIAGNNDFENTWRRILHDGVYEKQIIKTVNPKANIKSVVSKLNVINKNDRLEIVFQASPSVYDGRFANNGWLQELPDAVTKITWDNVAQVNPKTAKEYGLNKEDVIKLTLDNREIEIPVWIVPGVADNVILLELGFGRSGVGRVADNVGVNVYKLRTTQNYDFGYGAVLSKTGKTYKLSSTQDHGSMEARPIVREATLEEYRKHPEFAPEAVHHPPLASMWEDHKYDKGYQWGMAIDLTACTGCNACTVACQSENNIPIVGKEQVGNGREMHWIRVDRYYTGDTDNPEMVHQPVACQHCEMAPCEQVCPVAATVHDGEGLNTMVYNRCIGTRYCANNCPYKVRRFNFFNFTKDTPEIVKMAQNPDVTVRSRGVMEKCTYCVQRINRVKIEAKKENRDIRDGEIITACQQACPTGAIYFGNVNDPDSEVVKVKKRNRNYSLLGELNVRPRTSYLAKIRNPNPELIDKA